MLSCPFDALDQVVVLLRVLVAVVSFAVVWLVIGEMRSVSRE